MKIKVNAIELELHNGAKVKDAILKYFSDQGLKIPTNIPSVKDTYGNSVDGDGALRDGNSLFILSPPEKSSSLLKFVVTLLAIGMLISCSSTKKTTTHQQAEKQAVIFAVNDMHAAIDNFPKLAYIVDSLRTIYPDLLLVGAGDNQTGNPVNDQYAEKGFPIIDLMNATGFELSAVGNHEFDTSPEGFAKLTQKANFDFICANFTNNDWPDLKVKPFKIITLPNGLRLAFLSLLDINQNGIPDSHPNKVKGFTFYSPFEIAPNYLYLKDESDIFIALTHLGFENDVQLAESMPAGIDLIIGGHSHTTVDSERYFNDILITQAASKLKYGSLITLILKSDGSLQRHMQLIDIKNSNNENPSIRDMVDAYNDNPGLNEVIATATDDFSSHEELGYLMADAQRDAANADIALINPGGVRIDFLAKGPISIMNVYQLDPFGNELVVTQLSGNEIHALMLAASSLDERMPIYPSGIKTHLTVDANGKLTAVELFTESGNPLDMNKIYTVAMNNYMTQVYKYEHNDPGQSLFITTAEVTINYLKKIQQIPSYKQEKRVQIN